MIQRIQSIYLFLIPVISSGILYFFNFWVDEEGESKFILDLVDSNSLVFQGIALGFLITMILALISLFLFKKRLIQITINRISLFINIILLGVLVYLLLNLSGETFVSEKGIGSFLPLVTIVLLILANRAIQKDENLVKSVDRLR